MEDGALGLDCPPRGAQPDRSRRGLGVQETPEFAEIRRAFSRHRGD